MEKNQFSEQQRTPYNPSGLAMHTTSISNPGYTLQPDFTPAPGRIAVIHPVPEYSPAPTSTITSPADPPPAYPSSSEANSFGDFSDKVIRRAFIRKVYLTLMCQLLVTVGLICMFLYWPTLRSWVMVHVWFTYIWIPAVFVLIIVLSCFPQARRRIPLNFIFLGLFTAMEGLMLGSVTVFFAADAVMWAVGATGFVTFALSVFAMQSKWDFTLAAGTMWAIGWSLVSFGLLCAIIRTDWLYILYASLGTVVFSVYLVIDTQLMLGGKHKYSINPEEYIFAALNLYLDIINLFLFLLQIIGLSR
ncbi:protein lifeguard 1 isoform X1 [Amia ocellicauda]|uniref:protein lifeguard 1 isoform X1 n=1 Tax=Amia ocellicauda TaxID=2972642 RepID=UPI0034643410|nr:LFG1 protein [Amia calva]